MHSSQHHSDVTVVGNAVIFIPILAGLGELLWIRQPENLTVVVGTDVYFPCEYSGVDVLPYWRCTEETFYSLDVPLNQGYTFNNSGLIIANIQLPVNMTQLWCYCFLDLFDGYQESTTGHITITVMTAGDLIIGLSAQLSYSLFNMP